MKKLIIATLTVALAVVANASSVKWSMANGVLNPSPDGSASSGRASYYTMLIFSDSQADAVNTAIAAGNFTSLSDLAVSSYTAGKAGQFSGAVNGLTGTSATLFAVVFDTYSATETIADAGYYYKTGTFTNNQSRIQGGALCIREVANSTAAANTSPAVIRNCLFAFNGTTATTADSNGGGVYLCTNADMVMENCTIVSNNVPAYGTTNVSGGIHHRWGATLKNCIVAFNTVGGAPESDSGWCVNQSKYYVNCCSTSAQSRFKQEYGSFAADPKFADAAHGDFTLRPSSPCRDVGAAADWMTDATDLAGNARILGAAPDIGCFEYRPSAGLIILLR